MAYAVPIHHFLLVGYWDYHDFATEYMHITINSCKYMRGGGVDDRVGRNHRLLSVESHAFVSFSSHNIKILRFFCLTVRLVGRSFKFYWDIYCIKSNKVSEKHFFNV